MFTPSIRLTNLDNSLAGSYRVAITCALPDGTSSGTYYAYLKVIAATADPPSILYSPAKQFPSYPVYWAYSGEKYVMINDYITNPPEASTTYAIEVSSDNGVTYST